MVNPYFLTKLGLLALAGLNMLYFHFVTYKTVNEWDGARTLPSGAKIGRHGFAGGMDRRGLLRPRDRLYAGDLLLRV